MSRVQSVDIAGALKTSWLSSGTFQMRQEWSLPPETARSDLPTSTLKTSACQSKSVKERAETGWCEHQML